MEVTGQHSNLLKKPNNCSETFFSVLDSLLLLVCTCLFINCPYYCMNTNPPPPLYHPTLHMLSSVYQSCPVASTAVSSVTLAMKYSLYHESGSDCRENSAYYPVPTSDLAKRSHCSLWSFARPPDYKLSLPMLSYFHIHRFLSVMLWRHHTYILLQQWLVAVLEHSWIL